jgi:hypothetical protein
MNGTTNDEGGGNLLALICGALCKDTPLAEMFASPNQTDNRNNNNAATPLMSPVTNGELFCGIDEFLLVGLYEKMSGIALTSDGFPNVFLCCYFFLLYS